MDPAYFPEDMEALHVVVTDEIENTTAFAGVVDVVDDTEETEEERDRRINTDWWYRLHSRRVLLDVDAIREVRRLAWFTWAWCHDITSQTPLPRVITELW